MLRAFVAGLMLFLPTGTQAFSFGTFTAGEKILSIQLSAAGVGSVVTYNDTTGTLIFTANVSTITTDQQTFDIELGTVIFDSQVALDTEFVFPPNFVTADFFNVGVADLTVIDVAAGGSGLLLAANYTDALTFAASQEFGLVTGSMSGDFSVIGGVGDASFKAAFGDSGSFSALLAGFLSSGGGPVTDLCDLIEPPCIPGPIGSLDDFTATATTTLGPTVPEPAALVLLTLAAAAFARRSQSRYSHRVDCAKRGR